MEICLDLFHFFEDEDVVDEFRNCANDYQKEHLESINDEILNCLKFEDNDFKKD